MAFYKKLYSRWVDLFNNDRVGITTSFQYGGGRLKGDYTEFTEEDFWKCSDAMLEYCGYRLILYQLLQKKMYTTSKMLS